MSDRNSSPPIFFDAHDLVQVKTSRISDQEGHYGARSECLQVFSPIWGKPLKTSNIIVGEGVRLRPRGDRWLLPPLTDDFEPWGKGKEFIAP